MGSMENKPDSRDPFFSYPNPNPTSTASSGSSGSTAVGRNSDAGVSGLSDRRTHSSELPLGPTPSRTPRPGHRRSGSGALFYNAAAASSATSSATSPPSAGASLLPAGNICPSGKIGRSRCSSSPRSDVLGSGSGNYGHGSVVRGAAAAAGGGSNIERAMSSSDPEEVKRIGNDQYRRGNFGEALRIYERAISICPENAALRTNRAAALTGLNRLGDAVKECRQALAIDPAFGRAHQRLASLYLRLGQVENAVRHVFLAGQQPDAGELQRLQTVERHLAKCSDARKTGDWKIALMEADAAIAAGADSSPMLIASRAEALLHLHHLDEADTAVSSAVKLQSSSPSCLLTRFFGMLSDSYLHIVRAQVDMALGRFDNAAAAAERASQIDTSNAEILRIMSNVWIVARARAQGNELFNLGKFAEACMAYGEGLMYDPSNPVLYCNRAACRSKLGQFERSVEDCNEALMIKPNYIKALLRRAESNGKLERWADAVRDYEVLRNELPGDAKVAEALLHAQVSMKASRGVEMSNLKLGGQVEAITGLDRFHAVITLPGVSVVHFMVASNQHCIQITPFVDMLCNRYPSVNFLKVDVNESPAVSKEENVKAVPTFKIYKNGTRVKEMICPTHQVLEFSVRHYGM